MNHPIGGCEVTHKAAILDEIHETVTLHQIPLSAISWSNVYRKIKEKFPSSFPGTTVDGNGGRICKNFFKNK